MSVSNSRIVADLGCNGNAQSAPIGVAHAEVVVVRHGETDWNADGRIQGHLDIELNEIGRRQATAVGERLSREGKVSAIYSSDLKRALETATLIATACGGLEVIKDPGLREINLGELQGLRPGAAARVCPEAYKVLRSKKTDREIPGGGESIDQVYQRSTTCLRKISMQHKGKETIYVAHSPELCERSTKLNAIYMKVTPCIVCPGTVSQILPVPLSIASLKEFFQDYLLLTGLGEQL